MPAKSYLLIFTDIFSSSSSVLYYQILLQLVHVFIVLLVWNCASPRHSQNLLDLLSSLFFFLIIERRERRDTAHSLCSSEGLTGSLRVSGDGAEPKQEA